MTKHAFAPGISNLFGGIAAKASRSESGTHESIAPCESVAEAFVEVLHRAQAPSPTKRKSPPGAARGFSPLPRRRDDAGKGRVAESREPLVVPAALGAMSAAPCPTEARGPAPSPPGRITTPVPRSTPPRSGTISPPAPYSPVTQGPTPPRRPAISTMAHPSVSAREGRDTSVIESGSRRISGANTMAFGSNRDLAARRSDAPGREGAGADSKAGARVDAFPHVSPGPSRHAGAAGSAPALDLGSEKRAPDERQGAPLGGPRHVANGQGAAPQHPLPGSGGETAAAPKAIFAAPEPTRSRSQAPPAPPATPRAAAADPTARPLSSNVLPVGRVQAALAGASPHGTDLPRARARAADGSPAPLPAESRSRGEAAGGSRRAEVLEADRPQERPQGRNATSPLEPRPVISGAAQHAPEEPAGPHAGPPRAAPLATASAEPASPSTGAARVDLLADGARVRVESAASVELDLRIRVQDGVASMRVAGTAAPLVDLHRHDLRVSLERQGLSLGDLALSGGDADAGRRRGDAEDPEARSAGASPGSPPPRSPSIRRAHTNQLHVEA